MITKINLTGLKSIDNISFDCSKLNFIVGTNSSGKSTCLQGLLVAAQNGLNGDLISLGHFREVCNFNIKKNRIQWRIAQTTGVFKTGWIDETHQLAQSEEDVTQEGVKDSFDYKKGHLKYLSCQRIGGQDTYLKNLALLDTTIGIYGEYAMYYLLKYQKDPLDELLIKDKKHVTLAAQVDYWLYYIVGATVVTTDIIGTDLLKVSYSLMNGKSSRPKNVGSGISYIISVIILCLSSKKDDILIIENPEIHLHPKAQSKLCELFYFIAQSGRQLFIESHSDHLFNGIRAGIATDEMDANEIAVQFCSLDENSCTQVTKVNFGKNGQILNQEADLFDQFDLDLNRILRL